MFETFESKIQIEFDFWTKNRPLAHCATSPGICRGVVSIHGDLYASS